MKISIVSIVMAATGGKACEEKRLAASGVLAAGGGGGGAAAKISVSAAAAAATGGHHGSSGGGVIEKLQWRISETSGGWRNIAHACIIGAKSAGAGVGAKALRRRKANING